MLVLVFRTGVEGFEIGNWGSLTLDSLNIPIDPVFSINGRHHDLVPQHTMLKCDLSNRGTYLAEKSSAPLIQSTEQA